MLDSALTGGKGPVKIWPLAKDPSFAVSAKGAKDGKRRVFPCFAMVLCHAATHGKERPRLFMIGGASFADCQTGKMEARNVR